MTKIDYFKQQMEMKLKFIDQKEFNQNIFHCLCLKAFLYVFFVVVVEYLFIKSICRLRIFCNNHTI